MIRFAVTQMGAHDVGLDSNPWTHTNCSEV